MRDFEKKTNEYSCLNKGANRRGAALLVVLFIVMSITLVSLAFVTRSDRELTFGNNTVTRSKVDYVCQAGLEQAKMFLLNSQDIDLPAAGYWQGAASQQIDVGSEYYYDVLVERAGSSDSQSCSFRVVSTGYRLKDYQQQSVSSIEATLRVDPCVALWNSGSWQGDILTEVYGDACFGNTTSGMLRVYGDVFAKTTFEADLVQGNTSITGSMPVSVPGVNASFFDSGYYIQSEYFIVEILTDGTCSSVDYDSSSGNPAGVYYYDGDLTIESHNSINGTLVVTGDLIIDGYDNLITAKQNYPAVVVGGNLVFKSDGSELDIEGLARIKSTIHIESGVLGFALEVDGALFILGGGLSGDTASDGTITVVADHIKSSLLLWPTQDTPYLWSPAGGAYYNALKRN